MGGVWRKQEHLALPNRNVAESFVFFDNFEEHRATILIEPFGGLVNMIVGSSIGPAHNLERVSCCRYLASKAALGRPP